MDAIKRSTGELVAIKRCNNGIQEIEIAKYLSSIHVPQNHCVTVLETFADPLNPKVTLMVMPFLRPCNNPEFGNVGEVLDFIDQTIEVRCICH